MRNEDIDLGLAELTRLAASCLRAGPAGGLFERELDVDAPLAGLGLEPEALNAARRRLAGLLDLPAHAASALEAAPTLAGLAEVLNRCWTRQRVVFQTSGSTGEPKALPQPYALLAQESAALARLFAGRRRVVLLVPAQHIYGFLFGLMLPRALCVPALDLAPLPTAAFSRALTPGDLVVAFPLFWKKAAEAGLAFPEDVCAATSTGPCPAGVIRDLRRQGLARMTEIYGSSETGGVGFRHDPDAPYGLHGFWRRAGGGLIRLLPGGGESAAFEPPDHLDWPAPDRFRPAARRDAAVQVAGVNVFPGRVAEALGKHPAVAACAVRLMRPEEGDRLKAFVVLKPGVEPSAELTSGLTAWLAERFRPPERPRSITYGPALPQTTLGKPADW